ncbi:hypothetical protein TKK_0015678 [Trichogramma kaykai]
MTELHQLASALYHVYYSTIVTCLDLLEAVKYRLSKQAYRSEISGKAGKPNLWDKSHEGQLLGGQEDSHLQRAIKHVQQNWQDDNQTIVEAAYWDSVGPTGVRLG